MADFTRILPAGLKHLGQFWVGITSLSGSVFSRHQQEMRENEAQNAENGSKPTGKFTMRKDEVKIKLTEQGATRARGVFQQPGKTHA